MGTKIDQQPAAQPPVQTSAHQRSERRICASTRKLRVANAHQSPVGIRRVLRDGKIFNQSMVISRSRHHTIEQTPAAKETPLQQNRKRLYRCRRDDWRCDSDLRPQFEDDLVDRERRKGRHGTGSVSVQLPPRRQRRGAPSGNATRRSGPIQTMPTSRTTVRSDTVPSTWCSFQC